MTVDEMIEVLQAAKDGKAIQYRNIDIGGDWIDCSKTCLYYTPEYRIKPEPRECWVTEYQLDHEQDPVVLEVSTGHKYKAIRVREVL
jgi:hypothetical protein